MLDGLEDILVHVEAIINSISFSAFATAFNTDFFVVVSYDLIVGVHSWYGMLREQPWNSLRNSKSSLSRGCCPMTPGGLEAEAPGNDADSA